MLCVVLLSPAQAAYEYKASALTLRVTTPATAPGHVVVPPPDAPAAPSAGLSSSSLSFSSVPLGSSRTLSVSVLNTGTGSIDLQSLSVTGDAAYTSAFSCGSTLASGQSCLVSIQFRPTALGVATGTLNVQTSASAVPLSVALQGVGAAAGAYAAFSPTSIDFGAVMTGSSATRTVTLSNQGTATGNFSAIPSSEPSFSVDASSCQAVAPGSSCAVAVTFSPTSNASVTLTGLAPSDISTAQALSVQGRGSDSPVDVSTTALSFGQVAVGAASSVKSVQVANLGTGPASLGALEVSGQFEAGSNCPASLPAGDTCSVNVTYRPVAGGAASGSLSFETSGGARTVSLSGYGVVPLTAQLSSTFRSTVVTPGDADMGSTYVGQASDYVVYVRTSGSVGAVAASATLSGDASFKLVSFSKLYPYYMGGIGYQYSTASCGATTTATAATTCTGDALDANLAVPHHDLVLRVRFTPTAEAAQAATLAISYNGTTAQTEQLTLTASGVTPVEVIGSGHSGVPTQDLSLTGTGLQKVTAATLAGVATTIKGQSATQLVLTLPLTVTGNVMLNLTSSTGQVVSVPVSVAWPALSLSSALSPALVRVGANNTLTASATGIVGSPMLAINGTDYPASWTGTTLSLVQPGSLASGDYAVTLKALGGRSTAAGTLAVREPLTVSSLAPSSATSGTSAQSVTLAGTGFHAADTAVLTLGGQSYSPTSFTVSSATSAVAVFNLPVATGTGVITVTALDGATSSANLTVIPATVGTSTHSANGFTALRWADGTYASSCYKYLVPTAGYNAQSTSGLYWIQPSGQAATAVYCDMTNNGGGWTAVMVSPNDSAVTANWATANAVNWTSSAVSNPYAQGGSKYKLSDAFINAIPASGLGGARFRVYVADSTRTATRFVASRTYSSTSCGAASAVTSYSDPALSAGAWGPSNTVWSSTCGLHDDHNNGSTYNSGYFVLVQKSSTSGQMMGSTYGAYGAAQAVSAANRVALFIR